VPSAAAPPLPTATVYPCFYCGKPVPGTSSECPHCGHEQPAFLKRRAQERKATLQKSSGGAGAPRIPESSLTKAESEAHKEEVARFLLGGAIFLTAIGWLSGMSIFAFAGFLLAKHLEKTGGEAFREKKGIKFLKTAAIFGTILGVFRNGWW
jgi:hypothetical protein